MDMVHRAIRYFRGTQGIRISKRAEQYIIEELEEDLFPYGEDGHGMESIYRTVWDYIDAINAGEINLYKPLEERIIGRYGLLKDKYLRLLEKTDLIKDDDLPF